MHKPGFLRGTGQLYLRNLPEWTQDKGLNPRIVAINNDGAAERWPRTLNKTTPADVCFGRHKAFSKQRGEARQKALKARRLQHRQHAA